MKIYVSSATQMWWRRRKVVRDGHQPWTNPSINVGETAKSLYGRGKEHWYRADQKKMRRSFYLISLATNMLEGWDMIKWKGGIHSFVWSTKTFLYDLREPRYK